MNTYKCLYKLNPFLLQRTAGTPDNQFRRQFYNLIFQGLSSDESFQHSSSNVPHLDNRLVDRRQVEIFGFGDIVKTHQGNIFGDAQSLLLRSLVNPNGSLVIARKDRCWQILQTEQFSSAEQPGFCCEITRYNQIWINSNAHLFQTILVAL